MNEQENKNFFSKNWKKIKNSSGLTKLTIGVLLISFILSWMYIANNRTLESRDEERPISIEFDNWIRIGGLDGYTIGKRATVYWSFTSLEVHRIKVFASMSHQLFEENSEQAKNAIQQELFSGGFSHYYDNFVPPKNGNWYIFFVNDEVGNEEDIILDIVVRVRKGYDKFLNWLFNILKYIREYFLTFFISLASFVIGKASKKENGKERTEETKQTQPQEPPQKSS
ncbi:MAG: hypothetical protein GF308_14670 [Candidatus Heimdallarchaeota archaeon]|nr:hypothetical protein [Candidatus Heimdallarchaeota archaeon]